MDIEAFIEGYIICALWSSTDDEGEPLDARFDESDITGGSIQKIEEVCRDFVEANAQDLEAYCQRYSASWAGHDFWLTRNGHGAGFWDRSLGALGKRLTDAAKVYGSCELHVGADEFLYAH